MARYRYDYISKVSFDGPVRRHFFKLRCLPAAQPFQRILSESLHFFPSCQVKEGTDAFLNRFQYGQILEPHQSFYYESAGEVELSPYLIPDEHPAPLYLLPSPLCQQSTELTRFARELLPESLKDPFKKAQLISEAVHARMRYVPGSTSSATTAALAFAQREGVCQDYTHILLTLCRLSGIPARYVCGFLSGEGFTHAWAEIYDGAAWRALDPTNNRVIEEGCIKLAHGRDAADCPVNRGIYQGLVTERSSIRVFCERLT